MKLVIGNKRYSSWSLRPWVLLKHFSIPFEEKLIPLDQPQTTSQILQFSPSAKVPVLIDGNLTIWESLAIAEYCNEKFPEKKMWPQDLGARATARAVSSEMSSGFQTMRSHMSHDLKIELKDFDWSPAKAEVERVQQIWTDCLKTTGGPFLFGAFSIADAMYAPVVNRFLSYGVPCTGFAQKYVQTLRALPAHREWIDAAMVEELRVPRYER